MEVKEFVSEYKKCATDQLKDRFFKKHIVANYIPYELKIAHCENIAKNTMYLTVDEENNIYRQNSPMRYVLFVLTLIKLYTDIEIDFNDSLNIFNELDMNNLIDTIITYIPSSEYSKFQTVLNMIIDDEIENNRNIVSYIDNNISALKVMGSTLTEMLKENPDLLTE